MNTAMFFYQQELKKKIVRYEREIKQRENEIKRLERLEEQSDAPNCGMLTRKKALERDNAYAAIQIKKLRRQCF